jgi:hypothetical protein
MVTMYDADKRAAEQIANDWLAEAGLLKEDGSVNKGLIRERVVDLLISEAFVKTKGDKLALAIRKGDLTARVVPSLADAAVAPNLDRPTTLAFREVQSVVWAEASEKIDSASQRMVGERTNGEAVLVRAKMSAQMGHVFAAYVTTVPDLIFLDFLAPVDEKLRAYAEAFGRTAGLIGARQPALARKVEKAVETATKAAATRARDSLRLSAGSGENGAAPATDDSEAAA